MITFSCHSCRSALSMDDAFAGKPARCPTCKAVVTVPAPATVPPPPPIGAPSRRNEPVRMGATTTHRRFGFDCPWCSSRLEATMATAGQKGQCPTCANTITIPILDRYGRLIDPDSNKVLKPDPHPVHAYAAAGDRAPKILRHPNGQSIQCSRCNTLNPVTSNSCKSCGVPFTLEGTVQADRPAGSGFATTSLVLGVLGIPTCMIFVPSILAIVFGGIAMAQLRESPNNSARVTAIAGIVCGVIGLLINAMVLLN